MKNKVIHDNAAAIYGLSKLRVNPKGCGLVDV
jgi:hypothetical protein